MPFRYVDRLEPGRGEQSLWPGVDPLAMLHRAGGMIGHAAAQGGASAQLWAEAERRNYLGDITGGPGDPRCLLGIVRILTQHKAVILDRRAAPRRVDYDGIESGSEALALPGVDVGARESERRSLLTEMMVERSTTAAAGYHHHLTTVAR